MIIKLRKNIKKNDILNTIKLLDKIKIKSRDISTNEHNMLYVEECNKESVLKIDNVVSVEENLNLHSAHYNELVNIKLSNCTINRDNFVVIAGPCSVESVEQINEITSNIKDNIHVLRGGAYKPRTSPYDFQGLAKDGIEILKESKKKYNVPIISEISSIEDIKYFEDNVDIIQVGARNMQNFDLLKKLGLTKKPILLKRGLSNTIKEWILAAEYIMANGNKQVILCERGIRTFEDYTRNTLDLSAVLAVKELTNLPVIVDPSHAAGKWWMVEKLAKAALAVGADGIMIEVHNDPFNALSDGEQSIKPNEFNNLIEELKVLAPMFNKKVE